MQNNLVKFWDEARLDAAPYVHPQDVIRGVHIQPEVASYSDFLRAFERGMLLDRGLHLSLLPQPYFGDLTKAEVLLLLINPGLSACDYHAEENYPEFRKELIAAIRQEKTEHVFLNPKWAWTSGFRWWEGKLRDVAQVIAAKRFDGHYGGALADLSGRIASVEMVPYHSFRFGASLTMASARAARAFAASAASAGRTVIVMRRVNEWKLPDGPNVIK